MFQQLAGAELITVGKYVLLYVVSFITNLKILFQASQNLSDILKKTYLPIVDNEICKHMYKSILIIQEQLCAGGATVLNICNV